MFLELINSPRDLKNLSIEQLELLSEEIRERIWNYLVDGYAARGLTIHLMHVPSGTPKQNIRVAVETVRKFNEQSNIGG